MVIHKP